MPASHPWVRDCEIIPRESAWNAVIDRWSENNFQSGHWSVQSLENLRGKYWNLMQVQNQCGRIYGFKAKGAILPSCVGLQEPRASLNRSQTSIIDSWCLTGCFAVRGYSILELTFPSYTRFPTFSILSSSKNWFSAALTSKMVQVSYCHWCLLASARSDFFVGSNCLRGLIGQESIFGSPLNEPILQLAGLLAAPSTFRWLFLLGFVSHVPIGLSVMLQTVYELTQLCCKLVQFLLFWKIGFCSTT